MQLMIVIAITLEAFDQIIIFIGARDDDGGMAVFDQCAPKMKNTALGFIML
jgi:hypothetical protein